MGVPFGYFFVLNILMYQLYTVPQPSFLNDLVGEWDLVIKQEMFSLSLVSLSLLFFENHVVRSNWKLPNIHIPSLCLNFDSSWIICHLKTVS